MRCPLVFAAACWPVIAAGSVPAADDLTEMSLVDLASVEVTSVSKSSEALQRAAATIFVITHEDIARSGATNIPEALRLAPNLLVTQTGASSWTIAARGFGGNTSAQNFSNKLLMLIDGRSVYTPLFSGIYADTLDVLLEDVERIEVISGAGATLWGANAMNGVVNVITRPSDLSQGSFADVVGGSDVQSAALRGGYRLSGDATLRAYAQEFHRGALEFADGTTAHDGWSKGQGGFRSDWSTESDSLTVQGDWYRGSLQNAGQSDGLLEGGNLLARYSHRAQNSQFEAQLYYDDSEQFGPAGGGGFVVHTTDLSLQETLDLGSRQHLVLGGGMRLYAYGITNTASLLFEPPSHNLTLSNAFLEDNVALADRVNLMVGVKLEDDPFSGWVPLPDARLSFALDQHSTLWAAASRAIRSPTPFDDEVVEKIGPVTFLAADTRFRPETVNAYEVGLRAQPLGELSFSISGFYNAYDDLRSVDPDPATGFLPLRWGNSLSGHSSGVDAWAGWQPASWWRLSPGLSWVRERLHFEPGARELLGVSQAADDPSWHASLTSSMNLPHRLTFDATYRHVAALPDPALRGYDAFDLRLGWRPAKGMEFSLSGVNLLHDRHLESPPPAGEVVLRGIRAEARFRF